jgi:uncharacterized protein
VARTAKGAEGAERLWVYWAHEEGAAKIRWGTPGDVDRCVTHLSKTEVGDPQRYCQAIRDAVIPGGRMWSLADLMNEIRTAETPVASTVHHPFGSPSGPGLFHVKGLQLPAYIQNVAHAFRRKGLSESEAIQRAVGVVKDWAAGRAPGGGHVHPDVQAAAAKAVAEWEAAKAAAHASGGKNRSFQVTELEYRAPMTAASQNDLPDDAFAYIEPGGSKDSSGKTVPRSLRHFPVHDAAHVRNALSRAPQSPFGDKAMPKIKAAAAKFGVQVGDSDGGRSVLLDEEVREVRITSQYKDLDSRLELRSDGEGGQWIGGYASVFMPRESRNLGGFIERVAPHAFDEARAGGWQDVVCRFNHDSNYVLGTAAADTLQLRTNNVGLDYQVKPPQAEERIRELVARGDIRYSSFAFRCRPGGDEWGVTDQNFPQRTLHDIELVDVAPVLTPAYPDATAAVRATSPALRSLANQMQITVDEVRSLAEADELRRLFVRTDRPIYRPEPKRLFGPAAAAMLLARKTDPYADEN